MSEISNFISCVGGQALSALSGKKLNTQEVQEVEKYFQAFKNSVENKGRNYARAIASKNPGSEKITRKFFDDIESLFRLELNFPKNVDSEAKNFLRTIINNARYKARSFVGDFVEFFKSPEGILREKLGYWDDQPKEIYSVI